jgi:uncharacterized Tic20 family protein
MSDNVPPLISSPAPQPPTISDAQIRTWHMWCHLSTLSGMFLPLGFVLGPLIIWQIKKNEVPSIEAHGKAALNFQLTLLILAIGIAIVGFILSFFCVGFLFFFLLPLVGLAGIIFPIIAGLKANEGKEYSYPYSFSLVT